jgi:hypothetical protein
MGFLSLGAWLRLRLKLGIRYGNAGEAQLDSLAQQARDGRVICLVLQNGVEVVRLFEELDFEPERASYFHWATL